MSKSKFIILLTLTISFLSHYSCIRDKNPIYIEDNPPEYEKYFNTWPDTIFATGVGVPNPNVPLNGQRAAALRDAKLNLFRALLDIIYNLPISDTLTLQNYMFENDEIGNQIEVYIRDFEVLKMTELSTGYIEVFGCILSEGIKTILISHLE